MLQKLTVGRTKLSQRQGVEGKYAEFGGCEGVEGGPVPVRMMLLYLALRLVVLVLILMLSCSVKRDF